MIKKISSLLFLALCLGKVSQAVLPTPLLTAPLDASGGNPANTLINWYNVTGATSYEFKINANPTLNGAAIQNSASSQFSCTDLFYGTTYYWQVRALKTTGTIDSSDWTQIFSFTTLTELSLSGPANGAVHQFPRCLLNWSNTGGITHYEVQVDENNTFSSASLVDSLLPDSISEFYTTKLKFGTAYYWRARAMHALDTTEWTLPINFTTLDSIYLSAPSNGASFLSTSALLNWDYVSGIESYEVQIDKVPDFNSSSLQSTTLLDSLSQWTPANLEFGTNYYWRVRAWHSNDTTQWSEVWSFSTLVSLTLSAPANNSINHAPNVILNWNYITAPINYDSEYDTTANFNSPLHVYATNDTVSEFITSNLLFGTKYYWRARVHNAIDTSQWSATWAFTTLSHLNPTAPVNGATNVASKVTLNWTSVSGLTGYEIRVDTLPDYSSPFLIFLSSTTSSQQLTNLYFGKTYYWSIRAHHSADTSSWTNNWVFTTASGVSLTSPLNNSIAANPRTNLNWATLSGSTSYLIQYDTSASFSSSVLISVQTTVSNLFTSNLYFNQKYYWRVKAINLVDTSTWSAVWTFTTLNQLVHTSPLDGVINQALATQLNWTGASGAGGYIYRYDSSPLFNVAPQTGNSIGTNSRANITLPLYGQTYYWQVAVFDSVDTSGWSNPWSFTTLYQIAIVPSLISPVDLAISLPASSVTFVWNQVPSVLGYEFSYSTSPSFTTAISTSSLDTFGVSGLLNYFTTYYWRVRASDASGYSPWSSVYSFTTENPMSTAPLLIAPGDASINIISPASFSWNSIPIAASYECEYALDSLFSSSTTLIVNDTFAISQPLLPLSNYYWRVRGLLGNISSPWSIVWHFSTQNPFTSSPILIAPGNLSQSLSGPVNFVWNSLSPATSYECEYDTDSLFSSPVTLIANDTTAVSLVLGNFTKYFWRVRGVFHTANSSWSTVWNFKTNDAFIPALLYPSNGDTGLVSPLTFSWSNVSSTTSYECQYSTDSLFSNPISLVSTSDTIQSLSLAPFTKYYWRVRAADGTQYYSWSSTWHFTSSVMIGIKTNFEHDQFSLYPNPSTGILYLVSTNLLRDSQNLELISSDGRLIGNYKTVGESVNRLDFTGLSKGVYTLKIYTKTAVVIKKIVLQ